MKKFITALIMIVIVMVSTNNTFGQLKNKDVYEYTFTIDTLKGADNSTFTLPLQVDGPYDYCYTIQADSIDHSEKVTIRLYEYTGTYWGKARYLTLTSTNDTTIVGTCYGLKQKLYFSQAADNTKLKVGVTLKKRF